MEIGWGVWQGIQRGQKEVSICTHFSTLCDDPSKKLKLAADASAYCIGAVLSHVFANGYEKPTAYTSRTLSQAEWWYAQIDKELWDWYLVWDIFTIIYMAESLFGHYHKLRIWTQICDSPLAATHLQRWVVVLSAYSYEVEFWRTDSTNADIVSRIPLKESRF